MHHLWNSEMRQLRYGGNIDHSQLVDDEQKRPTVISSRPKVKIVCLSSQVFLNNETNHIVLFNKLTNFH